MTISLTEHLLVTALPASGSWQVLTDIVSLAASPFAVSDPATNGQRYYRIVAPAP